MDTSVLTPQGVFFLPQHLVVPLFQRPYVWDEAEQWRPLWQDIVRMAELRLRDPYTSARHFLGAVVLQSTEVPHGHVSAKNVIDGQQRLTTLQLLTDAAAVVFEEAGLDSHAQQLTDLTHNRSYGASERPDLKLAHSNSDKDAFHEVMEAEPPVVHETLRHAASRITRAHEFFVSAAREWLGGPASADFPRRGEALAYVLSQGLQLVVIDLKAQEDSQEIFETLNARGTPLTAADLVKNFVFQRLDAEGADTRLAYADDWRFETSFWTAEAPGVRYGISRSSLFINQWLESRLGEEVGTKQTFSRFKHYVEHETGEKMTVLLKELKQQADLYERWTTAAADTKRTELDPFERTVARMQAARVELLTPSLLWLHEPALGIPTEVAVEVAGMLESWIVRRLLLRLSLSSLGRPMADFVRTHRNVPHEALVDRARLFLTRLDASTNYWPGDAEIREHLVTEQAYRRYQRARLRMFLEAAEDHLRSEHDYPAVSRVGYPIEHVLPQRWKANWPVDSLEAEIERSEHVHRLGNLTLLTRSLNGSVSNSGWTTKRSNLVEHDVFLLNRRFRDATTWDEAGIDERTAWMTEALIATWPVPEGHQGTVADATVKEPSWVEVKHLVAAGLLAPGVELSARPGQWEEARAEITASGGIKVNDRVFTSPSAAGTFVKGGRATNGWDFWLLPDGRRLKDLRAEYRGEKPEPAVRFDWSRLHAILEALPEGRWTSYSDLADAVGTAPQPLGGHITTCPQCSHAWRVLTAEGKVATNFAWSDPTDDRDPLDLLLTEGVLFSDGRADPTARLSGDDLASLVEGVDE